GGSKAQGVRLEWHVVMKGAATVLKGQARLHGKRLAMHGLLVLTRRTSDPPATPPATCDSSFFTGQVMGRVLLPICANCHTAGGAAATANFRVTANDPVATQASLGLHIDTANPEESRILRKPLAELPHAGGPQLARGSAEFQILDQWVNMVATGQ